MVTQAIATAAENTDIRWARKDEARDIARLFLISSDGLAAYIWSRIGDAGGSLEDIGTARYARSGTAFSFENCLVVTSGGRVIGMAHAFEMPEGDAPTAEEDPVLRPYAELEDPGSLYLSGLAVFEDQRGSGVGSQLMDHVETLARANGLPRVSLICFERNRRALEFYHRRGYRELARRPIVPHPSLHYSDGEALLLARNVFGSDRRRYSASRA